MSRWLNRSFPAISFPAINVLYYNLIVTVASCVLSLNRKLRFCDTRQRTDSRILHVIFEVRKDDFFWLCDRVGRILRIIAEGRTVSSMTAPILHLFPVDMEHIYKHYIRFINTPVSYTHLSQHRLDFSIHLRASRMCRMKMSRCFHNRRWAHRENDNVWIRRIHAADRSSSPVSYTHLDVYKRQEFSQNYTAFWDKLEKSNFFLESILELQDRSWDDRTLAWINRQGIGDGGQWDMRCV